MTGKLATYIVKYIGTLFISFPLFINTADGQSSLIVISDALSGTPIPNTNIRNTSSAQSWVSDLQGRSKIEGKEGDSLYISHVSYGDTSLRISKALSHLKITLFPKSLDAVEVMVNSSFNRKASQGLNDIPMEFLTTVPSIFGEPDIIKSISFLPGVSEGQEGYSHFFVRGGDQDQNLILFDGATMFNVNHYGGFVSMFHSDMIGSVNFYKSYWPSKYGGRLSSVMEVNTAEGNYKQHQQSVDISILAPKIQLSGPILRDKISYHIGTRRTLLDLVTGPVSRQIKKGKRTGNIGNLVTQDLNLRVDGKITENQHLALSALYGKDGMSFYENDLDYGSLASNHYRIRNRVAALNYHWYATSSTTFKAHASYSGYLHYFEDAEKDFRGQSDGSPWPGYDNKESYRNTGNTIQSKKIRIDATTSIGNNWKANYGVEYEKIIYDINLSRWETTDDQTVNLYSANLGKQQASTMALFTDAEYRFSSFLRVNMGLRLPRYRYIDYKTLLPEPKLLAIFDLNSNSTINTSFNLQRQHTLLLGFTDPEGLFREFYATADEQIPPAVSKQWSLGYFRSALRWVDNFSLELFYKAQTGISKYIPSPDEDRAVLEYHDYVHGQGENRTYGIEILAQKTAGSLHGSASYTYAHSRSAYPTLNNGKTFNADFDVRHSVNMLLIYRFGKGYNASGQWVYKTGRPFTLPTSMSQGNEWVGDFPIIPELNNYRMPAFHRLDIGIKRDWLSKRAKKHWFGIGLYNVYNRVNPFFVRTEDSPGKMKVYGMFPIIPHFHIGFEL